MGGLRKKEALEEGWSQWEVDSGKKGGHGREEDSMGGTREERWI